MASGSEVPDVGTDAPQVDLNTASEKDLRTLSGMGTALAQRVIEYRETHAGFQTPEEITEVPGIGQGLYDRWAPRLTINFGAEGDVGRMTAEAKSITMEDMMEGETEMNEKQDVSVVGTDVVVTEEQGEEAELQENVGEEQEAPASDISESAYEEEMIAEAEFEAEEVKEPEIAQEPTEGTTPFEPAALPDEEEKEEESVEPEPVAEAPKQRGAFWGWVLASLLGGILGMIFALLVFAGINGTLDVNNSAAILDLQDRVDSLSAEVAEQESAIDGVVERVSAIEDVSPRLEEVETAVGGLEEDAQALSERADTLSSEVESVVDDLVRIEEDVAASMTFLTRLQELLNELFDNASGASE
jgi:competence ComEA-like helix-hairpin-helix protein